ncbi:aminopeptidase [Candidatus Bathyarchaeota archaeon]|nr:aminopeptidase [Candidatus Bathyarchaeota archaeon]
MEASEASKNALENVLEASSGERILIVCDERKTEVGEAFARGALALGLWTRLVILQKQEEPRTEIPEHLQKILAQKPDIYINLLRGNREETPFRIKLIKTETHDHKARLGHCPGVTLDMLTEGALALAPEEHKSMQGHANRLMHDLEDTVTVEIRNPAGTNLTLLTPDRKFFTDTKLDWKTMKWMNLPVGEVIVAPVEDSLSGNLVCESAIGGVGLLKKPLIIQAKEGKVKKVESKDKSVLKQVNSALKTDSWSNTIGEFAFGINPSARVCNEFLETEKIKGTCHIAFGNNTEFPGGKNPSMNHMDFLITKPTVFVTYKSGKKTNILALGKFR